jgi:Tfp pilus assembly protein PilN
MSVLDINLIATQRRQKQRSVTIMRCAIYSLIVLGVGVAMLYARLAVATRIAEGRITEVQAKLSDPALADRITRISFLETNIARLGPRVALLEKVHGSEAAWIQILRDIAACVPTNNNLWLAQLASKRAQKDQILSLKGSAFNQADIGEFMLNLDRPEWSKAPSLGYSQVSMSGKGRAVIMFEVSVPLTRVIGSDLK